jgi:hypothetical protein
LVSTSERSRRDGLPGPCALDAAAQSQLPQGSPHHA